MSLAPTGAATAIQPKSNNLSLASATSASGYVFPPIHAFPAFFTRQPKAITFESQSRQWQALILSYCRYHRIFRIELSEGALSRDVGSGNDMSELWANSRISRRLRSDFILELMHLMAKAGTVAYDPSLPSQRLNSTSVPVLPNGTGALILWRSPSEWGQIIYHWVVESGQTNSIMTMYELQEPTPSKDFADLPPVLLKLALQTLVKQGKAQIFQASQAGDGEGVKFV